jgi:UDP-N-acetylmuramyl pentapeptide phosphotransferase/UDP-N-acetylglucosamine-1-phosphate transferase
MNYLIEIVALVISFILVILSVPPILRVARVKELFEPFGIRKVHKQLVPPLGGIAIFISFILSTIITTDGTSLVLLKYIIASVVLVFFVGLKDDLVTISARKKLVVQVAAAIILIVLGNIRFTNFYGILGIYDIDYITSLIVSLFAMIVITNAFNLVDGVDGLASGLAMMAATVLGVWFYLAGHYQLSIISFALIGSLAGFFLFNVFGNSNKLFMGDSGSLIIGIVISTLIIQFNELNIVKTTPFAIGAAPAVSFAIIIVPLIDTLRVMAIRISKNKSPFLPDKNHIHHRLLELFENHLKVTVTLVSVNGLLIVFALFLNDMSFNINLQILTIFLAGIGLSVFPSILLKAKTSSEKISMELDEQTMTIVPESIFLDSYHNKKKKKTIYNMQHYKSKTNGKNKQVSFVEKIAK